MSVVKGLSAERSTIKGVEVNYLYSLMESSVFLSIPISVKDNPRI